jgi:hypothetical protein
MVDLADVERVAATPPADQKAVGQHDRGGVTVDARPQAPLILLPPHLSFGFFMELLHCVAPMRITDQGFERGRDRQVAPGVCPLLWLAPRARSPSSQPTCRCPSLVTRQQHTARHFLRSQPVVPWRQQTVRHCQRGKVWSSWSTRCPGLVADRAPLTRKSARTPTT